MRDFNSIGFITSGNPNHYDHTKTLAKEFRARMKDSDPSGVHLMKFWTGDCGGSEAGIRDLHEDELADYLSDAAPEGFVFDIRTDSRGNSNYGYFVRGESK